MPMARIDTIRVTKQADVDVELAKRSRNKQLREAVSMSERHAPFSSQGDPAWPCCPVTATCKGVPCAAHPGWGAKGHDVCNGCQQSCLALRSQEAVVSEMVK